MGSDAELHFFQAPGELPAGSVSPSELAIQATDTFLGNVSGATTSPVAVTLSSLAGGGGGLTYNGTAHRFEYTGAGSAVNITPSGAVGVVDISTLNCGGVVTVQPTATFNIDGFSVKSDGFWFDVIYRDTTTHVGTFNENAGATTTSIRNPGNTAAYFSTQEVVRFHYRNSRWRAQGPRTWMPGVTVGGGLIAEPFTVYVSCPSGGAAGTADDVTIWSAAAPFALRVLDATLRVSTAVALSSAALRTASGGAGSVVLPDPTTATQTFSTAAVGPFDDVAVATATVASGGSLFLRRSDRSVVGELVLTCIRT